MGFIGHFSSVQNMFLTTLFIIGILCRVSSAQVEEDDTQIMLETIIDKLYELFSKFNGKSMAAS